MTAYIAGKITGDPHYREKFAAAQREMERKGFTVLNPAVLPKGLTDADYMRICFAMIDCANLVAFLPDALDSRGARLELQYCKHTGKAVRWPWGFDRPPDDSDYVREKFERTEVVLYGKE
jgi:hypothetical protein